MTTFDILRPTGARALPLVVHVPHGSTVVPDAYRSDFVLDDAALARELLLMTDRYTDELAAVATSLGGTAFVNRVSQLVMDPERFVDDAREPMAAKGMGAIYTSRNDGSPLRRPDFTAAERAERIEALYRPYHLALEEVVGVHLAQFGRCLIVDLHSFPKAPLPYEDASLPRPRVCIGFEAFHVDAELRDVWAYFLEANQIELGLNTPFAGSLVPNRYYGEDRRVRSLMLELRRDLYMNEATGAKTEQFATAAFYVRVMLTSAAQSVGLEDDP